MRHTQVRQQVADQRHQRRQQQPDQSDVVVVAQDQVVDQLAHPEIREHRLGHQRAGKQVAEPQRHDGYHRDHGVPQGMPPYHAALRDALGAGGADIVLPQLLQQSRPHEPRIAADADQRQGSHRHHQIGQALPQAPAAADWRHPAGRQHARA